jgi:hypothetical protein
MYTLLGRPKNLQSVTKVCRITGFAANPYKP